MNNVLETMPKIQQPVGDSQDPTYVNPSDKKQASTQNTQNHPNPISTFNASPSVMSDAHNKRNKRNKVLFVLTLVIMAVGGLVYWLVLLPMAENFLIQTYPALGYVPQELSKEFPDDRFFVAVETTYDGPSGREVSEIALTIDTRSTVNSSDRKYLGERVCELIEQSGDYYDKVTIISKQALTLGVFSADFTESRSCEEWRDDPAVSIGDVVDKVISE